MNYNGCHIQEELLPFILEVVGQEGPQRKVVMANKASMGEGMVWSAREILLTVRSTALTQGAW